MVAEVWEEVEEAKKYEWAAVDWEDDRLDQILWWWFGQDAYENEHSLSMTVWLVG